MPDRWSEVPPTAGLPMYWSDFMGAGSAPPLEVTLAATLGVPWARLECSGTAALVIALSTLAASSERTDVVIPAYTCPLVALAVLHCGLRPVICDVAPESFDFDPDALTKCCNQRTLAIIATHLGGRVAAIDPIMRIAGQCGALVIEDAAQSFGARWEEKSAGTVGDIGFFSLAAGKGLTLYEGGLLVARDSTMRGALEKTSRGLARANLLWEMRRSVELAAYALVYRPAFLRFAYGIPMRRALRKGRYLGAVGDDFQGTIPIHRVGGFRRHAGANAAERLPAFLDALSLQASVRVKKLQAIPRLKVITDPAGAHGTWPFFMVLMPSVSSCAMALDRLWSMALGVTRLFIHALPDYQDLQPQLGTCDVPNARDLASRMLTISNSPWLHDPEFDRICNELTEVLTGVGEQ